MHKDVGEVISSVMSLFIEGVYNGQMPDDAYGIKNNKITLPCVITTQYSTFVTW